MSYIKNTAILSFENFKESALYFDHVLPISMARMRDDSDVGDIFIGYPEEIPAKALHHLIYGIEGKTNSISYKAKMFDLVTKHWVDFATQISPYANLGCPRPDNSNKFDCYLEQKKLKTAYFEDSQLPNSVPIRKIVANYANQFGFKTFSLSIGNSDTARSL